MNVAMFPNCHCYSTSCKKGDVPDFVKMAEAYGSKGYFVTSNDQLKDTILEAREYAEKNKKPVIVECMVAPDELVMPMIKGGASFEDIML